MAQHKQRLDRLMVSRGLAPTRNKAQALIMAGEVRINGQLAYKSGEQILESSDIEVLAAMPYVGRGGYKLAGALDELDIPVAGGTFADVGACTGGFTDVLLQRGAARVYAIDVGYGQLAWKLRQDERVKVLERTNVRYLSELPERIDGAVIDVSFISLKLVLPSVRGWLKDEAFILALIKPQFEAGMDQVGKGGVIRDTAIHKQVLVSILGWCLKNQLFPAGLVRSSLAGGDGNIEFLVWLQSEPYLGFNSAAAIEHVLREE